MNSAAVCLCLGPTSLLLAVYIETRRVEEVEEAEEEKEEEEQ